MDRSATASRHDQPDSRSYDSEQPGRHDRVASDDPLPVRPLALACAPGHGSLASLIGRSGCGRQYAS
jgi:hypothetical protein